MRAGVVVTAILALLSLAGCETTREQAAKFTQQGSKAFAAKGLRVSAANRSVSVLERTVVTDANGTAAALVLRNTGTRTLADVPIAISVRTAKGKVVYRNDDPGLEPGLTHAALLAPGQTVTWVDDQVTPVGGTPAAVVARIGAGKPAPAGAGQVRIDVGATKLEGDPASGLTASGRLFNRSSIAQQNVVVAVVGRRGGRIVAAGRALVPFLKAGGDDKFQAFFIGDPRATQLSFDAQPSTLR